jgi:hypothetical protein
MAIASGIGASVELAGEHPTASLHGERVGRVLVAVASDEVARLRTALEVGSVQGRRIGTAGDDALRVEIGGSSLSCPVAELASAWRTAF